MKKSDIYEVAIKIMGLYLFFTSISLIREILMAFALISQEKQFNVTADDFSKTMLILSIVNFVLVILFAAFLTFKTKSIVKLVCKQTDFEETSSLFADRKVIYEIALVVMGMLLFLWTIPEFVFKLKNYFLFGQIKMPDMYNEKYFIGVALIKIIVGLLSIIFAKWIASILVKENRNN